MGYTCAEKNENTKRRGNEAKMLYTEKKKCQEKEDVLALNKKSINPALDLLYLFNKEN